MTFYEDLNICWKIYIYCSEICSCWMIYRASVRVYTLHIKTIPCLISSNILFIFVYYILCPIFSSFFHWKFFRIKIKNNMAGYFEKNILWVKAIIWGSQGKICSYINCNFWRKRYTFMKKRIFYIVTKQKFQNMNFHLI